MTDATQPPQGLRSDCDVVVVGSGLAGLSTAALLAHSGCSVQVLEQGESPGGLAGAFRRGPYVFDPAVHATGLGATTWNFLDHLGVSEQVPYVSPPKTYGARIADGPSFVAPGGWDEFIEAHAQAADGNAAGEVRDFFEVCRTFLAELKFLPMRMDARGLAETLDVRPHLARYRVATVSDVMDDLSMGPQARGIAAVAWPYLGTGPSRLSFLNFALMLNASMTDHRYPLGSFQSLVDALVGVVRDAGGSVVTSTPVERILVEGGRTVGVRTEAGDEIRCRGVVSGADARHTLLDLVGEEHLTASYLRRLRRLRPSLSVFGVYAATDLDLRQLDLANETFLHPSLDHDRNHQKCAAGELSSAWMSNTTLLDPSLAPAGEHTVILCTMAPWTVGRDGRSRNQARAEQLVRSFDRVIPGLSDNLTHLEAATPATWNRFTRGYQGAAYGWENTPHQIGNKRLRYRTPVDGLILTGHWTETGTSSFRAIWAAAPTGRAMLEWLDSPALADVPQAFYQPSSQAPASPVGLGRSGADNDVVEAIR